MNSLDSMLQRNKDFAARQSAAGTLMPSLPRALPNAGGASRTVPDAIRIPPANDASAATLADRAPAQSAVRTFIVRLMSQGSEVRNREIHT